MITSNSVRIRLLAALGLMLAFTVVHGEGIAGAAEMPSDRLTGFLQQMRSNLAMKNGDLLTHFCGATFNDAFSAKQVIWK